MFRDPNLKGTVEAAYIDPKEDEKLYLALSSITSEKTGHYISCAYVRNKQLIVAHSCPAIKAGLNCWHIDATLEAYKKNYFWKLELENFKVVSINYENRLQRTWNQIPIPGELLNIYGKVD